MKSKNLNKVLPILKAAIDGDVDASGQIRLQAMVGDASTRRYFRITVDNETFVVMYLPQDAHRSDEITKAGNPGELPFLQVAAFLSEGGIGTPEIILSRVDERVIILEDLGDETFERLLKRGMNKSDLYERAITEMVRMHKWAFEHPDPDCVCFNRTFDRDLLTWECHHFTEWGMEELTGKALSTGETDVLNRMFNIIVDHLVSVPQGFVHRDYQSRNLMMHNDMIRIIDFQDALMGPYVYDITALLRDSYVFFDENETDFYLDYFYDARKKTGLPVESSVDFKKTFYFQTIQRKLKDAGRFVFIDRKKGNPKFLPNIPRSLKYALDSMKRFPEFNDARTLVKSWLAQYIPEDK